VPDDGRPGVEFLDDGLLVGGDVTDAFPGEHAGILAGLLDGGRIIWPGRCDCHVSSVLEELGPVSPAAVQQPQPVNEHDGLLA
jgi:hypothetical protein